VPDALAAAPPELGPQFAPYLRGYWRGVRSPGLHPLTWEELVGTRQRRQLGSHQDCHHGNFRDRAHLRLVVNPDSDSKGFLCSSSGLGPGCLRESRLAFYLQLALHRRPLAPSAGPLRGSCSRPGKSPGRLSRRKWSRCLRLPSSAGLTALQTPADTVGEKWWAHFSSPVPLPLGGALRSICEAKDFC